jgi:SAM-dependent MidA family methyltransferase
MKMPDALIREEIAKSGAISFARFMELALYCPETGYYETKKDNVGRHGDFITSVSTGSLFGELLAFQFAEWLGEFTIYDLRFTIAEAGAHDGKLARDILDWLQAHRPELFARLEYWIIEPSEIRRGWQKETLTPCSGKVHWASQLSELGHSIAENRQRQFSILFSNELLDAFPVHCFGWDAARRDWFERGVTWDGGAFQWTRIAGSGKAPCADWGKICPPELEAVLPDGYAVEFSPAAEQWWREAARCLEHGRLMTIDYGYDFGEMFVPHRRLGTVRAYAGHRQADNVLANPGRQDLTAHVNFGAIRRAGEEAGLGTEFFGGQPQFLTRILQRATTEKCFANLDGKRVRQFQTLTHPEHLGRAFRVLVQQRGCMSANCRRIDATHNVA